MTGTILEEFLVLFNRLKSEINESPENLNWLPHEKPSLQSLCYELDKCYNKINKNITSKGSKYTVVPAIFSDLWAEYISDYKDLIAKASQKEKQRYEEELLDFYKRAVKEAAEKGQTEEEFLDDIRKNFPKGTGATFDPTEDDAATLVDELFYKLNLIVENDVMPETITDKQLGAFMFFENTIGLNLYDINRRWGKAPELFIPDHALNKNIQPLIDLYNQAVKAYVFGLNEASIAMCRALLEHILKYHYKINKSSLKDIISFAEKNYAKLKKLQLHDLRDLGNKVMHSYEEGHRKEDNLVIVFLLTLKHLVQNIPKSTHI